MGFVDNKYVSKFISGGAPPAKFRQASAAQVSSSTLPTGWIQQWHTTSQRWCYLEQATGRTQWEPPSIQDAASDERAAQDGLYNDTSSMMSGTTAHTVHRSTGGPNSTEVQPAVARAHMYTNMPTAAERAAIWEKERLRQEREGDKEPPTGIKKLLKYPGQVVNYGGLST